MTFWILLAAYLVGWLGFSVTIARFFAKEEGIDRDSEVMDKVLAIFTGMSVATFWPLVIPGGYFYQKVCGGQK